MRGFGIDVETFCNRCPEFEVSVKEDILYVNDFSKMSNINYYNRVITCAHIDKCRGIYDKAVKDIKDEQYRAFKELNDE